MLSIDALADAGIKVLYFLLKLDKFRIWIDQERMDSEKVELLSGLFFLPLDQVDMVCQLFLRYFLHNI